MTDQEILKKSIEKAHENGYFHAMYSQMNEYENRDHGWYNPAFLEEDYMSIIFSHDFAKAFWGEQEIARHYRLNERLSTASHKVYSPAEICSEFKGGKRLPNCEGLGHWRESVDWQYHLQQMVLEDKPLKYLEKFI